MKHGKDISKLKWYDKKVVVTFLDKNYKWDFKYRIEKREPPTPYFLFKVVFFLSMFGVGCGWFM